MLSGILKCCLWRFEDAFLPPGGLKIFSFDAQARTFELENSPTEKPRLYGGVFLKQLSKIALKKPACQIWEALVLSFCTCMHASSPATHRIRDAPCGGLKRKPIGGGGGQSHADANQPYSPRKVGWAHSKSGACPGRWQLSRQPGVWPCLCLSTLWWPTSGRRERPWKVTEAGGVRPRRNTPARKVVKLTSQQTQTWAIACRDFQ